MTRKLLVVRRNDVLSSLGRGPFRALPREEVERHYAAVEVLTSDATTPLGTPGDMGLAIGVAVHFNHAWVTLPVTEGIRSMVLSSPMTVSGEPPLFLGGEFVEAGRRCLDAALCTADGYELRLAGLLWEASLLMVLCVARLRQRMVQPREGGAGDVAMHGHGDLLALRPHLDGRSQTVADHLSAF